jgi:hypothetical protein
MFLPHPDLRLKQHRVSDLTAYLSALSRKPGLKNWQFRQAIDAIRILLVDLVGLDWARALIGTTGESPQDRCPLLIPLWCEMSIMFRGKERRQSNVIAMKSGWLIPVYSNVLPPRSKRPQRYQS